MTVYTPRSITEWPHLRRDNQAREEIAKLEAHVRELEEALRFYAEPERYDGAPWAVSPEDVWRDGGRRARVALGADRQAP